MTTTTVDLITEPGIYQLDETAYHADTALAPTLGRSLSATGAKTLLTNPARFVHERAHGRPEKRVYDLGTLAHALILGNPDQRVTVIDAYDWRTKAAKEARATAYANGKVPVHRGDLRNVAPLRRAVRRHPLASAILSTGRPEQTLYWIDPDTGVTCRARIDWLHDIALVDVKTVPYGGTDTAALAKAAATYDWPLQAAHYTDGYEAITGQRLPFLFIAVEKEPPYFVRVVQLSDADMAEGRERIRAARDLFARYESDGYPEPSPDIDTLTLPRWYAAA